MDSMVNTRSSHDQDLPLYDELHIRVLTDTASQLAKQYATVDGVEGFVIGGSVARDFADDQSDLEAYVYHNGRIPSRDQITEIITGLGFVTTRSPDLHWTHDAWGVHSFFGTDRLKVELGYRDVTTIRARLDAYLSGAVAVRDGIHDVAFGWYPSGLAACLAECKILYDPAGRVADLKAVASTFPTALAGTLLRFHYDEAAGIWEHKLRAAHLRGDGLHFQAALARVVRSVVIAVFTVNAVHYPGDKWNRAYLVRMREVPDNFLADLDRVLNAAPADHAGQAVVLGIVGEWVRWLGKHC